MDPSSKARRAGAAIGALLATASFARTAGAVQYCDDGSLPHPIYAIGGSSTTPIFANLGTALSKANPPQTFIYQSSGGACSGVTAIINGVQITGNGVYWDATGTQQTCTFQVPETADVGVAGSFATQCPGIPSVPAGVGDFLGPVQAFEFIVPYTSSETAISAEAAYFLFGFNAGASTPSYPVAPWTVPANVITRNNQSAAAIIIALALGVPLADLTHAGTGFFTDGKNNPGSLSAVAGAAGAAINSTIGFVSAEVAEGAAPMKIKTLAYQHYKQQCGWLPNSAPGIFDKINVRNGHYALWANTHFLAAVDASKNPTNANAKNVIGWFQDTIAPPTGVDALAAAIKAGAVPDCAMEVKRDTDVGPLQSYAPAAPCGCYFDSIALGATSCTACTGSAQCPATAPHCRKGYCEVN